MFRRRELCNLKDPIEGELCIQIAADSFGWKFIMKCFFCKVEMVKSKEITKDGEYYSDRFTCPKCGHWERENFQYKDGKLPFKEE